MVIAIEAHLRFVVDVVKNDRYESGKRRERAHGYNGAAEQHGVHRQRGEHRNGMEAERLAEAVPMGDRVSLAAQRRRRFVIT